MDTCAVDHCIRLAAVLAPTITDDVGLCEHHAPWLRVIPRQQTDGEQRATVCAPSPRRT